MPVTLDTRTTLLDYAKMQDPDGSAAIVYEILNQVLEMLQDAPAFPANGTFGNRTTIRSSLPSVTRAKINKGTKRSKGTWEQRNDAMAIYDGRSEVDTRQRDLIGDELFLAERDRQDMGFLESLAQTVGGDLLYGDVKVDEASFDGIAPRMNALNAGADRTKSQVWSMGTVTGGDGTSVYAMDWGERGAHLIFPPNTVSGMQPKNLGDLSVNDSNGDPFMAAVTQYLWYVGLAVKDPRHIARLANIDISDANLVSPTQGTLLRALIDILTEMPAPMGMQRVLYAPTRIHAAYWKQAIDKANGALTISDYLGRPTLHCWLYPLRRMDQISVAEGTVT